MNDLDYKNFINASGKFLLFNCGYNAFVNSYMRVYFLAIFVSLIDSKFISLNISISPFIGMIVMFYIVRNKIEKVSFKTIFILIIPGYLSIPLIDYNINYHYIIVMFMDSILIEYLTLFDNRIRALNIIQEHRIRFNNSLSLISNIGSSLGGLVSIVITLKSIDVKVARLILFILSDMYIINIYLLVKYNKIKY
jgi:hypothetical protein